MKKRRTLIISILLIAAICLGIGYAGFTSDMLVNSEAILGPKQSEVHFSDAVKKDTTSPGIEVTVVGIKDAQGNLLKARSFDLTVSNFSGANETAEVDVTIENPHDFEVRIEKLTIEADKKTNQAGVQYFTVTETLGNNTTIAAGQSKTFTIKVVCNASSPDKITENFEVKFAAVAGTLAQTGTETGSTT